ACAKARAALDALDALDEPVPAENWPASRIDENRIWITACTDPFGRRTETVPYLHRIASKSLCDLGKVGGAAWLLDETELAVRVLREALSRLRAPGVRGASGGVLWALEWACIDSGRWDEALAAAPAARAERHLEARTLLERALARVDPAPGLRLEQLAARARGLLAEPADAEGYLAAPLADPAGNTWPFERAQLQLDYGEWLRRQRRINDAKPVLRDALETF